MLPEDRDNAYVGHYLDIGFGVTITPPGTMGRMTSSLVVQPGDKVLEIGTGSGYQSALLSYLTTRSTRSRSFPSSPARTRGVYDGLIGKGYREYAVDHDAQAATAITAGRRLRPSTRSSSPAASTTSRRRCCSN